MKTSPVFTSLTTLLFTISAFPQVPAPPNYNAQTISLLSPQGQQETCRIAPKFQLELSSARYKPSDLDDEKTLCGLNFYAPTLGVCPKLNSTNPGTLISLIPQGMPKSVFQANHCRDNDPKQKIVAKFKQSISCSYTGSGLAAYHLSRMLGGAGRVPVSVYRTMDQKEHAKVTQTARTLLAGRTDVISQTWAQMATRHANYPGQQNPYLYDLQGQVYGFLSDNPTGEDKYTEMSGVFSDRATRYQVFMQQPIFQRVISPALVSAQLNKNDDKNFFPAILAMKDLSDMIVLDSLLSQEDRIGNIHFKFRWYSYANGKINEAKSKARRAVRGEEALINYRNNHFTAIVPAAELAEQTALGAVLVKELILKDNDCGVDVTKRSNMMRSISAIEQVKHIDYKTYVAVMKLARFIRENPTKAQDFFLKEMRFTRNDYMNNRISFLSNLERVETSLLNNCRSGVLKFDLDLAEQKSGPVTGIKPCDV